MDPTAQTSKPHSGFERLPVRRDARCGGTWLTFGQRASRKCMNTWLGFGIFGTPTRRGQAQIASTVRQGEGLVRCRRLSPRIELVSKS